MTATQCLWAVHLPWTVAAVAFWGALAIAMVDVRRDGWDGLGTLAWTAFVSVLPTIGVLLVVLAALRIDIAWAPAPLVGFQLGMPASTAICLVVVLGPWSRDRSTWFGIAQTLAAVLSVGATVAVTVFWPALD